MTESGNSCSFKSCCFVVFYSILSFQDNMNMREKTCLHFSEFDEMAVKQFDRYFMVYEKMLL